MKMGQVISHKLVSPDKLRDVLITRTAIKTLQSEKVVEKVISFQFRDANEAIKLCNQVEISGFGKFISSRSKMRKKLRKMEVIIIRLQRLLGVEGIEEKDSVALNK